MAISLSNDKLNKKQAEKREKQTHIWLILQRIYGVFSENLKKNAFCVVEPKKRNMVYFIVKKNTPKDRYKQKLYISKKNY